MIRFTHVNILCLLLITVALSGCGQDPKTITIRGNLTNLPDGKLVLLDNSPHDHTTKIDSVNIIGGKFEFTISRAAYPYPIPVQLAHYDKQGIKRVFNFLNNRKDHTLSEFILEDGVEINGTLKERETPERFKMPVVMTNPPIPKRLNPTGKKVIMVYSKEQIGKANDVLYILSSREPAIAVRPDRPIVGARQSDVMYNDTANFREITDLGKMKSLIEAHPYSFYYLNILKQRIADLKNDQFAYVFSAFDRDVRESQPGRELSNYVATRNTTKLTRRVELPDENGQLRPLLSSTARYNVIILWASWCGGCREEIPELKNVYADFGRNKAVNMVSVSIDEHANRWKKALDEEKMPWTQLLINEDAKKYAREYFSYDNAVPLLIVTDKDGKVLKRMVGYDDDHIAEIRAVLGGKS